MGMTTTQQRNHQISRHNEIRRVCAQTYAIHPDWDAEDHLAYLADEGWLANDGDWTFADADETITAVTGLNGPVDGSVAAYVKTWLFMPARGFEGVR
jgi:hypothetical protein